MVLDEIKRLGQILRRGFCRSFQENGEPCTLDPVVQRRLRIPQRTGQPGFVCKVVFNSDEGTVEIYLCVEEVKITQKENLSTLV